MAKEDKARDDGKSVHSLFGRSAVAAACGGNSEAARCVRDRGDGSAVSFGVLRKACRREAEAVALQSCHARRMFVEAERTGVIPYPEEA